MDPCHIIDMRWNSLILDEKWRMDVNLWMKTICWMQSELWMIIFILMRKFQQLFLMETVSKTEKYILDENCHQCLWMKKYWTHYFANAHRLKVRLVTFCLCEWRATWAENGRLWLLIGCLNLEKILLKFITFA